MSKRENLLLSVILRTVCLDLIWNGSYSAEAITVIEAKSYDIVFVSLPPPDMMLRENVLSVLRACSVLFATSIYPYHLFGLWKLDPLCFLTEPFDTQDLQYALDKHFGRSHIG